MTQVERPSVHSHRNSSLRNKFRDKDYRHSYMATHIKTFLAKQLRAFRGSMSQGEFGQKIGKPQPVVNRNENASYGKFTLQNLLDIAEKLDVAVHVRFVDFHRFIELTEDLSGKALKPTPYHQANSEVSLEVDSGNIVVTPGTAHLNLIGFAPEVKIETAAKALTIPHNDIISMEAYRARKSGILQQIPTRQPEPQQGGLVAIVGGR